MTAVPPPIDFRFAPVAQGLEGVALIYWEVRTTVDGPVVDQLHPDFANIRFKLAGDWAYGSARSRLSPVTEFATVTGPTSQGQWASVEQGHGFNITLLPLAWLRLFGGAAVQWHNRLRPLAELLGEDEAGALADAMARASSFEQRVAIANSSLGRLWEASEPHPREAELAAIDEALRDPTCGTVEELGRRASLPRHSLCRLTRRAYGMLPKQLLRRERFLRMLRTMEVRSYREWQDFLDPQYVDQSHMIRDFKYFLGLSPSRYFALERPMLESSLLAMQQLWASGVDPFHSAPKPQPE
jgi:AraC-like DNA-binding protein